MCAREYYPRWAKFEITGGAGNICFRRGRWFPKIFILREKSRNKPTQSPVMVAVHSITTKITNQKALQTFTQWHQASTL